MFKYSIDLVWSDEDDCYVATIPEFPGLSAFGDTPEEAVEEAKIAAKGFIEVYEEDGCPLPIPNVLKQFSGQTRLRLPKSLHAALNQEAKQEGVSLNTHILHVLSEKHNIPALRDEIKKLTKLFLANNMPNISSINSTPETPPEARNTFFFNVGNEKQNTRTKH